MAKFTELLKRSTRPVYPIKFLVLQTIINEVSMYCYNKYVVVTINKQILAQMHTSLCYIYYHLTALYVAI